MQTATAINVQVPAVPAAFLARGARDSARPAERAPDRDAGAPRHLSRDQEIYAEGDDATCFYKVLSGGVRTCKLLDDGRRQIDAFHLAGDIFGLEAGATHRFSAEAVGDAVVVAVRRDAASGDPALAAEVLASAMRSLARARDHMLLLGRKSAREKVASFLLGITARASTDDHVDLPMSRVDIADHLGMTVETVSRTLTRFERDGVIELPCDRRTVVLRDKRVLRRLDT
ncbi:MAG: helix-turn-helix domain-containing protein [Rhodospirillales bacterium]|nr:MAG: helix-turn-helix domain-containing protein [Rhodospirillales bacterium]